MDIEQIIKGLREIKNNLVCIDGSNDADEYINESLDIVNKLLRECGADE